MKNVSTAVVALVALFALGTTNAYADAAAGEALFASTKCKNCHKITDKKKVGPGLAGVAKRVSDDWLKAWLADANGVWTANEGYTAELKKTMKKEDKPKTAHKTRKLTDQEIADLIAYMKTL